MKGQIIQAIDIFSNLYPDYQIDFIYLWIVRDNMIIFRIKGIKDDSEVIEMIKIDL